MHPTTKRELTISATYWFTYLPYIFQIVDVCEEYQKEQKLARLLEEIGCEPQNKILIFVETKRKADDLTRLMRRDGYVLTYLLPV